MSNPRRPLAGRTPARPGVEAILAAPAARGNGMLAGGALRRAVVGPVADSANAEDLAGRLRFG